jgi:hypothetical protein
LRWLDYREFGELEGALAQHAESTFNRLKPYEQRSFGIVMRQLVTLGQRDEEIVSRRTVPYSDLCSDPNRIDSSAGAKNFVDVFIQNRLLVADTDPDGTGVVSVVA